ncbi:hypothetical protein CLU79DRAFT_835114 [Phycomyces nitens]|nr:hypothetical protein CLU79DRAFT_835114 [Phycomyces nitens]
MASTRNIFNQPSNNGRIVTLQSGGLNERFSQLSQLSQPSYTKKVHVREEVVTSSSVFSRIRGNTASQGGRKSGSNGIQSRLGKPVGGVQKRTNAQPMSGVVRHGQTNGRGKQTTGTVGGGRKQQAQNNGPRGSHQKPQRGGPAGPKGRQEKPKKATAEDLDKALDAYMMKDPKTAQLKLDEEITSYMDEAGDILMEL